MGCGLAKEYRIINLYDLADIKLKNNLIEIGNININYTLIKKIEILDNNVILYVDIEDYEKYIFVFENINNLYNNICNSILLQKTKILF
jgi:hypothetical protein